MNCDQPARQRLRAEHGRRAERPDHFVVAHINDPEIAVVPGALAGDGQNDVRVDGGDAQVDDLKFFSGEPLAQQHLQVTARAVGRLRIAHRGGFAENKNADGVRRFDRRNQKRSGQRASWGGKKRKVKFSLLMK